MKNTIGIIYTNKMLQVDSLRVNYRLSTSSTNLLQSKATMKKNLKERKKEAFLNETPTIHDSIRPLVLEASSFPADNER